MRKRTPLLILCILIVLGLGYYLGSRQRAPRTPLPGARTVPPEAPSAQPQAVPALAPEPASPAAVPPEGQAAPSPPAAVLAPSAGVEKLPPGHPRSAIAHRVARVWGRDDRGKAGGVVGLSIVVDPNITEAELSNLAEDILVANQDAEQMNVRIYDSEDALSPELHEAHDPSIAEHTIGRIWVNKTATRSNPRVQIQIRGKNLVPKDQMPIAEQEPPARN